jgi:hypothetical protein
MDKDELLERAADPKYISGIHNYCDRWCERCPFTSRCLNFSLSEERFGDLEEKDARNEEFWERFSEMLHDTLAMVTEMAEEMGVDLEAVRAEMDADEADGDEDLPTSLLSHLSMNYATAAGEWLDANEHSFYERIGTLSRPHLISSEDLPHQDVIGINDAIEVIRWYQYQIHVKLRRAIEGAADEEEDSDLSSFPKDSDGSAKVALIGTDRSLSAWRFLLKHLPRHEAQPKGLIELLDSIRKRTEIHFPHARAFVRPGFDDNPHGGNREH